MRGHKTPLGRILQREDIETIGCNGMSYQIVHLQSANHEYANAPLTRTPELIVSGYTPTR